MDNIKDAIANVTKSVVNTSKGLIKSTKLAIDLSGEEARHKAIYMEIGKKVHEIYAYGGSLGKFFDEKYAEILECEAKIDILKRNLEAAKGTRTCGKCGKTVALTAEFCPKCGTRLEVKTAAESKPKDYYLVDGGPGESEFAEDIIINEAEVLTHVPEESIMYEEETAYAEPEVLRPCPLCGKNNPADCRYCSSCGKLL